MASQEAVQLRVLWEELPVEPVMELERKMKVLLCGDSRVGKKQLACQFTAQGPQSNRTSTLTTIGEPPVSAHRAIHCPLRTPP